MGKAAKRRAASTVTLILAALFATKIQPTSAHGDFKEIRQMQREAERERRASQRERREAERQRLEAQKAQEAAKAAREAAAEAAKTAKAAQQAAMAAREAAKAAQSSAKSSAQSGAKPAPSASSQAASSTPKKDDPSGDDNSKKKSSEQQQSQEQKTSEQKSSDKSPAKEVKSKPQPEPEPEDIEPPRTVVEMFERMVGASKTKLDKTPDAAGSAAASVRQNNPNTAPLLPTVSAKPPPKNDGQKGPDTKDRKSNPSHIVRAEMELPSLGGRELLAPNLDHDSRDRLTALGFEVRGERSYGLIETTVTRLAAPQGMPVEKAVTLVNQELPNQSVAENRIYRPYQSAAVKVDRPRNTILPASPLPCTPDRCFAPASVHWSPAHRKCARAFPIGIIDTSIDLNHPTFTDRNISVGSFTSGGKPAKDATHGTGVLALLAGRGDGGTPGLLPDAHFYAANVFFDDGKGQPMTDTVSLLKALEWLDANGVRIINMSVSGPRDDLVGLAIAKLAQRGVIVTAAAGNGGTNGPVSYPAAYPDVVSVTAINREGHIYRHATHGRYIDLAAPGVGVWTAYPDAREGPQSGTSFAVPFATAAIAAVYDSLSLRERSKAGVLAAISVSDMGASGPDPIYGRGLIQAPPQICTKPADSTPVASSPPDPAETLPWANAAPSIGFGYAPSGY